MGRSCLSLAKNDQFPPAAAHKRAEAGRGAEELNKEDEFDGQENSRARRFWNVLALKSSCPCFLVSCAGIAEAGLGRPAVPTLPDAGGAVFDGESPRRERVVVDEPVGDVVAADLRQRQHQVLGADEAGGEMAVARLDVLDKILRGELFFGVQLRRNADTLVRFR